MDKKNGTRHACCLEKAIMQSPSWIYSYDAMTSTILLTADYPERESSPMAWSECIPNHHNRGTEHTRISSSSPQSVVIFFTKFSTVWSPQMWMVFARTPRRTRDQPAPRSGSPSIWISSMTHTYTHELSLFFIHHSTDRYCTSRQYMKYGLLAHLWRSSDGTSAYTIPQFQSAALFWYCCFWGSYKPLQPTTSTVHNKCHSTPLSIPSISYFGLLQILNGLIRLATIGSSLQASYRQILCTLW